MKRNSFLIVSKALAADKRLSVTAKLLFAELLDHHNGKTGQCNPKRQRLADALGVSVPTISRALSDLRAHGFIQSSKRRYTNSYGIQSDQIDPAGGGPVGSNRSGLSDQIDPAAPPYPLYEPYLREPERPRAEARSRRRASQNQNPGNAAIEFPAPPRKEMGLAEMFDPLNGRFLTKTQMDQLTYAMICENHRRKYGA
jgi:DNA-binding transcriptional MocR family regulator